MQMPSIKSVLLLGIWAICICCCAAAPAQDPLDPDNEFGPLNEGPAPTVVSEQEPVAEVNETPLETSVETPAQSADESLAESPIETTFETTFETPFETPVNQQELQDIAPLFEPDIDNFGEGSYFDRPQSAESFDPDLPSNGADTDRSQNRTRVGYDRGFVIANKEPRKLRAGDFPFRLRLNGWGQLRQTYFSSHDPTREDANQFQLKRARLIFSGSAFTSDFSYFFQLDGRSSSGDDIRLLDYRLTYDVGRHRWGLERGKFAFRTGKYKMPFHMARRLSGRQFEFTDRSVASTYFDVNRSLAWGFLGQIDWFRVPVYWETAVFNGLVTGGAETGSSGALDSNFAFSGRLTWYPIGEWGFGQLADFDIHEQLAMRMGLGFANSTIDEIGETEFDSIRVVDSGRRLSNLLPDPVNQYTVNLFSVDASFKYCGWSFTTECYFRVINDFRGADVPDLYDYGYWIQMGKFLVPKKFQVLTRVSGVVGDSGTLGLNNESSDEYATGFVYYAREQNAKVTFDATYVNGAPINSASLDLSPGDNGWVFRSQIQFAF